MNLTYYILLISIILLQSCNNNIDTKNDVSNFQPSSYKDTSYDINSDGIIDFSIGYYEIATDDYPSSFGVFSGGIGIKEKNMILIDSTFSPLFLKVKSKINKKLNLNSNWSEHSTHLISLHRHYSNYDSIWTINSSLNKDFYIAIKLKTEKSLLVGWIKLLLNKNNGKIQIIDKEFTENEEITIDR